MKISTILDHIDSRHMALPEFQRGYVWNRDQVRGLFESLYRRHPVGGLLVWATESKTAAHRGDGRGQPGGLSLLHRRGGLQGIRAGGGAGRGRLSFAGQRWRHQLLTFIFVQIHYRFSNTWR